MKREIIKVLLLILLLGFDSLGQCNSIDDGWKNIKPLNTDKTTVEKILGKPKASLDNFYNYEVDGFFIHIKYSNASCKESGYGKGTYDVPFETVINYKITLTKEVELKDLKFQRDKYERQIDSEQNKLVYYFNRDAGILILVSIVNGVEYVGQIHFDPNSADKKKFECKIPK